jgi:hypothetical protein
VTSEQLIIFGFIAAAFIAGWLTGTLTERRERKARVNQAPVAAEGPPPEATPDERLEGAVYESRRELDRTIHAYHAAVAWSLREEDGVPSASSEVTLEVLARALVALAIAIDHASEELRIEDPMAALLRASGFELRELAQDVMLHLGESQLPNGVFDRLEQHLTATASTILAPGRLQPGVT